jgi:protein HOOK3
MKAEMQEKELLELHSKLEELQKVGDEARHLKDEIDILRETADKAVKYEGTIASYKKKLEEYGDLKRQMKLLEDKNTYYMQQNMDLEEVYASDGFIIIIVIIIVIVTYAGWVV